VPAYGVLTRKTLSRATTGGCPDRSHWDAIYPKKSTLERLSPPGWRARKRRRQGVEALFDGLLRDLQRRVPEQCLRATTPARASQTEPSWHQMNINRQLVIVRVALIDILSGAGQLVAKVSDESRCGSRDADGSAAVRHQRFALLPGHTSSLDRTRSYQSDVSIAKLPSPFTFPLPMGERKPRQRWGKVFLQVCYQIGISFVGQV